MVAGLKGAEQGLKATDAVLEEYGELAHAGQIEAGSLLGLWRKHAFHECHLSFVTCHL